MCDKTQCSAVEHLRHFMRLVIRVELLVQTSTRDYMVGTVNQWLCKELFGPIIPHIGDCLYFSELKQVKDTFKVERVIHQVGGVPMNLVPIHIRLEECVFTSNPDDIYNARRKYTEQISQLQACGWIDYVPERIDFI